MRPFKTLCAALLILIGTAMPPAIAQNTNLPGILQIGSRSPVPYYGIRYRPTITSSNVTLSTNNFLYLAGASSNLVLMVPSTTTLDDGRTWEVKNIGTNTVTLRASRTNDIFDLSGTNSAITSLSSVLITKEGTNLWKH
jgi:hypothetical protein